MQESEGAQQWQKSARGKKLEDEHRIITKSEEEQPGGKLTRRKPPPKMLHVGAPSIKS